MANNVSIATKPLVYEVFRFINNKVWNALAEYIDNSIQSYLDHKELLQSINPNGGKLKVSIDIDFNNDTIIIEDNAYGITKENYQRAFELANIPLDNKGLNEFGMGMKVSSIWLSNIWKVETSSYGDPIEKILVFNLQEVVDNEQLELPVTERNCSPDLHYTRITLSDLSLNKPTVRQLAYIKKHITSIYTEYLREDILDLYINEEKLEYQELKILKAPHYLNPNGEPILWKKDIDYSVQDGRYSVKGYIALLQTMSTAVDNGFLLFRRGRVIGSSYDDRYRPKLLCGQEGSPQYKRIFGELHLEGFDVSFTKNSFQEDDDFSMFIELLKEKLATDKSFDIFNQGQYYRPQKTKKDIRDMGTNLVKQIAKGFTEPIKPTNNPSSSPANAPTTATTPASPVIPVSTSAIVPPPVTEVNEVEEDVQLQPIRISVPLSNGTKVSLTIKGNKTTSGLYTLASITNNDGEMEYVATINLSNPIFERFDKSLSTSDGLEQLAYFIEVLVASEISILQGGGDAIHAINFRNMFNTLFGNI